MALALDNRKLLSAGVHEATLKEVEECFARFQKSDRRIKLFGKLRDYIAAVKKAGCGTAVILDGSFVMSCIDEPEDIDLILILPPDWDLAADLKPYQYNLVSKRHVRREYGIDAFPVLPASTDEREWTAFFGQVGVRWCRQFGWPPDSPKRGRKGDTMICNVDELRVVRKQLARVENALASLRAAVLPKNKRNFEILSEGYVDQIAELKAELDSYRPARKTKETGNGKRKTARKRPTR